MASSILNKVYVDVDWVANEYLRRCKTGAWKPENTRDAVKCWNLERALEAELDGLPAPAPVTEAELLLEEDEEGNEVAASGQVVLLEVDGPSV